MNSNDELRAKLQYLESLEVRHGVVGVSVKVADGASLSSEALVDSVIAGVERGVRCLDNLDKFPIAHA